ncbi:hypothetical protein Tco_0080204 [Tanacetum coccineum]
MVEPEPVKKLSKKDQLMLDEELAFKLQAEEEEEERLAREKTQHIKEANIVSWDNVQAMNKSLIVKWLNKLQAKETREVKLFKEKSKFVLYNSKNKIETTLNQ